MTTTDTGPQTETGRTLLKGRAPALDDTSPEAGDQWADYNDLERAILAIEAEERRLTVEQAIDIIMSEPYWPRLGAVRRRAIREKVARLAQQDGTGETRA